MLRSERYKPFDHITESNDVLWVKCATIHGPTPKPDTAIGIKESAFNDVEMAKLKYHCTIDRPTRFSEEMYFPFLICEVKSINTPIEESERQAMHSASIAVRAILRLLQRTEDEKKLDAQILVFSISHNHNTARIFGHFPKFNGSDVTFHRRAILETSLGNGIMEDDWSKPYQLGLAICEQFFPTHLERIRGALAKHKDPSVESFTARPELDGPQDAETSTRDNGLFKRPRQPSSISTHREIAILMEQVSALTEELREQRQEFRERQQEFREQQQESREQQQESREREKKLEDQLKQQQQGSREREEKLEDQARTRQEKLESQLARLLERGQ